MPVYTVEWGKALEDLVSNLSVKKGILKSEVVRRALASYAYFNELEAGLKLSLTDKDDNVIKDVFLP